MTRVIVAGALASKPGNGGEAWVRLTWALGLRRLGCEVVLAEQIASATCVGADGAPAPFAASVNRAWFDALVARFGLGGTACLVHEDGPETSGLTFEQLVAHAERADLLVNLSGHLTLAPVLARVGARLYVDLDPGYTQLWAAADDPGARLDGHDAFATVGANLGDPACPLPTNGLRWRPLRPPVLLDAWPASPPPPGSAFTTVATWRNPLGTIEHDGRAHGSKAHAFRRIVDLPHRAGGARFELALDLHPADERDGRALRDHGWTLADPRAVAGTPEAFRDYLRRSLAECSVAQPVYVETASGWFSDRTAHYLAGGRPALVEDTGLAGSLPLGEGLLTFRTPEQAAAGARAIASEPEHHGHAARALAEERFDSDRVLGDLLAELGIRPARHEAGAALAAVRAEPARHATAARALTEERLDARQVLPALLEAARR
jgi:hypothetical protein